MGLVIEYKFGLMDVMCVNMRLLLSMSDYLKLINDDFVSVVLLGVVGFFLGKNVVVVVVVVVMMFMRKIVLKVLYS